MTVNCVAEAAVTAALVVPKITTLFAAVVLNPVPLMVTVLPTMPEAGVNEAMVGCEKTQFA